jgi:hypothetical protein
VWAITANQEPDGPGTFDLTGTFELTDSGSVESLDDSTCYGTGDIATGTSVTVSDAAGKTIATGELGTSTLLREDGDTYGITETCEFAIVVQGVPKGSDFYKVEVSHRGTLQLTAVEAESGGFAGTLD